MELNAFVRSTLCSLVGDIMAVMGTLGLRVSARMTLAATLAACASSPAQGRSAAASGVASVRAQLERRYAENAVAFERGDLAAVMQLRAPDFHTITPDGQRRDRAAMEQYTQSFMNGIRKWNAQRANIDSLHVVGDTAYAIVTQYLDRMALRPGNQVRRIETWVTQRETWVRHGPAWLMWRVDQLRNQSRRVDGTIEDTATDSLGVQWRPSWPGTEIAVLSGSLSDGGPFVFRFRMPNGYWICPHTHPVDAHVRVVSGMFHVGMGQVLDTARVRMVMPGDSAILRKGMLHYEGAHGDTEIEIRGAGVWGIQFLDARHDPARGGACKAGT